MAALSCVEHRNKLEKIRCRHRNGELEEKISETEVNLGFGSVSVLQVEDRE